VLFSDRIRIVPELFEEDEFRRRILLTLNMNRIVQHLWEAIRFDNTKALEPVFDTERPNMSTSDMGPWYTGKPCEHTQRSYAFSDRHLVWWWRARHAGRAWDRSISG